MQIIFPECPFWENAPNLGTMRNLDWAFLAGGLFSQIGDRDFAIHGADLAYLAGVNPETEAYGQMCERYLRTFNGR